MAINRDKPTTRQPTFSLEEANKLIAEVTASRELLLQQKMELDALKARVADAPAKLTVAGKTPKQVQNELQCIRAFKKAGFGSVKPHEDARTFNRWVAAGFRPKEGTKSVRVNALRLFCKAQVRPLTVEERKAMTEQSAAAVARHEKAAKGKVIPIGEVHP